VKKTFQKKNISSPTVISRTFKLDEKSKLTKLEVRDKDFEKKNISSRALKNKKCENEERTISIFSQSCEGTLDSMVP